MTLIEKIQLSTFSINTKATAIMSALQSPELRDLLANQPNVRSPLQAVMNSLRSDIKRMEDARTLILKEEIQGEVEDAALGMIDATTTSIKAVIDAIEVIPEFKPQ